MTSVALRSITEDAEMHCIEIARVSSTRDNKRSQPYRLVRYLITNKHWSPFEHAYMTLEIVTSRVIAAQLLRHRSFTFQELSQRYQDVRNVFGEAELFMPIQLRWKGKTNRQSSHGECLDSKLHHRIKKHMSQTIVLYNDLLEAGIAKECARMILPLNTKTRVYMTGNIRSWIHFIQARLYDGAQAEIQIIAKGAKDIFMAQCPLFSKALNWVEPIKTL